MINIPKSLIDAVIMVLTETHLRDFLNDIDVVRADDVDYVRVAELDKQFPNNTYSEKQFRKSEYSLSVAKDSMNRLHGYILTKPGDDSTLIVKMLTNKQSRKSGVASKLLDHVINRDGRVSLNVRHHNIDAISLYTKKGFRLHHIEQAYYRNGDDAYHMRNF